MSPSTKHVLIVDDSQDICDMLAMLLRPHGLGCISATDALSARKLISTFQFTLYILDNSIPGLSGIDMCKEIRASGSSSPIIFYSGYCDQGHRTAASEAGATAFVVKPDVAELFEIVTKQLGL